jgi:hypothetical protein
VRSLLSAQQREELVAREGALGLRREGSEVQLLERLAWLRAVLAESPGVSQPDELQSAA